MNQARQKRRSEFLSAPRKDATMQTILIRSHLARFGVNGVVMVDPAAAFVGRPGYTVPKHPR